MIKSVLIANRGEIACRIIKTARRMGIRTIAVYSDADKNALHVRLADEAHPIGPAAASDSYLRAGRILSVAKEAGADAVHPGYGFLSENADFAELTSDAGMIFVGPSPSAIRSMGLKDKAKEIMADANVPIVPGYHGRNQSPDFLKRKAYEIGYPVLIKAVAGGGGKGMRKVMKALEFDTALDAAKREAQAAFGNDAVLIEKFIQSPRHVEIQVFGDTHGNVVHLFERDCSLQRRHQKVIEEAPAPGMTESVRAAMGKAACDAARAVGYHGAGTVEFIVDGANGLTEDGFFFMEMNTRLQVEHPITEAITGVDLVEWQLRVAANEELPLRQEDLQITGHAVEARIYAEDANNGFLPSTGALVAMNLGENSQTVRIDTGVEKGDVISPHYDPMIAKLIVHAPNRAQALSAMQRQLDNGRIMGPVTNLAFLSRLCGNSAFVGENFDTSLIDENLEHLIDETEISSATIAAGVAGLIEQTKKRISKEHQTTFSSVWSADDGFQLAGVRQTSFHFLLNGELVSGRVRFDADGISVLGSDDQWTNAKARPDVSCVVDDASNTVFVVENNRQSRFQSHVFELSDQGATVSADGAIPVPMHGKIISVTVVDGDEVEQGDILFSVEAMKMEHAVIAPSDGIVEGVSISAGEQVESGQQAMRVVSAQE